MLTNFELKRYVSWDDILHIKSLLSKTKGNREFVAGLLYRQLVESSIDFSVFKRIPDDDLREIGKIFILRNEGFFRLYNKTNRTKFFHNFKETATKYVQKVYRPYLNVLKKAASYESKIRLPPNICIIDIETEKTNFNDLKQSKLAFVGIRVFNLKGGRYLAEKHRIFEPHKHSELRSFLAEFRGIIIGHNIFGFDYRILQNVLSLRGIVKKTVDTYVFLHLKMHQRSRGLSLNSLSSINFKKQKLFKGKIVSQLWREGKHKLVIKYNKVDCDLTKRLWWTLLNKREISVQSYDRVREFKIWPQEVLYLTGQRKFFSYNSWRQKLRQNGHIVKSRRGYITIVRIGSKGWLYCSFCGEVSRIYRPAMTTVKCHKCGRQFSMYMSIGIGINRSESKAVIRRIYESEVPRYIRREITLDEFYTHCRQRRKGSTTAVMRGVLEKDYWDRFPIGTVDSKLRAIMLGHFDD